LTVHSDLGSQYASKQNAEGFCKDKALWGVSDTGNCFDSAVVESFFGDLKREQVQWRNYEICYAAQQNILRYISMFYNSHRLLHTRDTKARINIRWNQEY